MFRFALVDAENAEPLGVVSFAVPDIREGVSRTGSDGDRVWWFTPSVLRA
jgi:hypothetical protein